MAIEQAGADGRAQDPGLSDTLPDTPTQKGIMTRAVVTLLGGLFGGAMIFFNEVLAVRFLGVTTYGLYALAYAFTKIGEAISLCGLHVGILHFLPIYDRQGKRPLVLGTILASLTGPLLVACGLYLTLWFLAPWLATDFFHKPGLIPYIRIVSLAIPFMSLSEILGLATRGFGYAKYYVIARQVVPQLAFTFMLVLLWLAGWNKQWIGMVFVGAYVAAFSAGLISVGIILGRDVWHIKPLFPFRALYRYSFPILINSLLYMVIIWTDILMLGVFRSSDQIGVYRVCLQIVLFFNLFLLSFNAATCHIYPILEKENRHAELVQAYGTVTRWLIMVSVPIYLMMAYNGADILLLINSEFSSGKLPLLVLASGYFLHCALGSSGFLLVLCRHQKVEMANAAGAALANIVLNLLLIPRYGLMGAATATSISLIIITVLRVIQVRYLMHVPTLRFSFVRIVLVGIVVGLVLTVTTYVFDTGYSRGLGPMTIRIAGIGVVFAAGLWLFELTFQEKNVIKDLVTSWSHNRTTNGK